MSPHKLLPTVYVPLDQSEASKEVIPVASTIAQASGASICYVHAPDELEAASDLIEHLHLRREQIRNAVIEQVPGPPDEMIPRFAAQHPNSIIVMPMNASGREEVRGLGPVSKAVLQRAGCAIVFTPFKARPGAWDHWKPIHMVLPQDSSAECAAAVSPIAGIVHAKNARVTILHVPTYGDLWKTPERAALPIPRYLDQPQHGIRAWQEEFIERLRALANLPESIEIRLVLGMGEPVAEIIETSRAIPADLIVMPWYRDYPNATVLRPVLAQADCPVMVLPIATAEQATKVA
ncbi:MAG: hypothetical protein A2428_15195 [Bdellovibrionales bacterium RIFOXYC1_FULL_54_43]|nr:MAG: hypothetical protein A2428_15195 [Bdellovibrionales bacterium RIFOXYC1_FULL_54_43]OFZ78419.1 MAG: hypothetical protein A2603_09435 [Bdellovibrionales bacterium RIFOXYD1_FULL_55_31]